MWFIISWILWIFVGILKAVAWFCGLLLFGLWWNQGDLLYLPAKGEKRRTEFNPIGAQTPRQQGLPYEDVSLVCKDGVKLHAWLLPQQEPHKCPTLIVFHGNAGNIGYLLFNARELYQMLGMNILLVEYRGYGNSQLSRPCEVGLRLDGQAALEFVSKRSDLDSKRVLLFGRSLGGAVAIAVASIAPPGSIAALIVENTFTSIDSMVLEICWSTFGLRSQRLRRILSGVLFFFLSSHWSSLAVIGGLKVPMLFISGSSDELVPPAQMQELYDNAKGCEPRRLVVIPDGTHNETHMQDPPRYYHAFISFLTEVFRRKASIEGGVVTEADARQGESGNLVPWLAKCDDINRILRESYSV